MACASLYFVVNHLPSGEKIKLISLEIFEDQLNFLLYRSWSVGGCKIMLYACKGMARGREIRKFWEVFPQSKWIFKKVVFGCILNFIGGF